MVRFLVILLLGALAAAPAALADDVLPLPAEDQKEIATLLGPGLVSKALPSKLIDDPSVYFPLQEKAVTYQVTSGKGTGETQTLEVAKGKRPTCTPAGRFELSPTLTAFIHESPDQGLTMPAVSDAGEGVVVVTTPANPFVLKGMKPGETRSFSQTVAVNYLDEPTKEDYSGKLDAIRFLGRPHRPYRRDPFRQLARRVRTADRVIHECRCGRHSTADVRGRTLRSRHSPTLDARRAAPRTPPRSRTR